MRKNLDYFIPIGVGLVTLVYSPGISFDSFNAPKFVLLVGLGISSFYYILINLRNWPQYTSKYFAAIIALFLISSLLTLLLSKQPFWQSIYGVQGRNTGFLTILSFLALLSATARSFTFNSEKLIVKTLLYSGGATLVYGLLQAFGMDPVSWASASESPVIGFLGNPNFVGSFLGMIASVVFAKILEPGVNFKLKLSLLLYLALDLFVIYKTKALQGFLVAGISCFVVALYYLHTKIKSKILIISAISIGIVGFVAVLLDIFQKSFWKPLLYGSTIDYRGDYWRAGWKMTAHNPIFGVGFDGYRDHYRQFRDLRSVLRPAGENLNDSAHNVLLDISSSGGFPLVTLYILLIALTIYAALQILVKNTEYKPNSIAIFAAWVGFTAQSVISINQIGLAIWGWVLSGYVIGAYYLKKNGQVEAKTTNTRNRKSASKTSAVGIFVSMLIGMLVAFPIFRADYVFKKGIDSKNVEKLVLGTKAWPQQPTRMNLASVLLLQSKFYVQARDLSRNSVALNPNFFESWKILAVNPELTPAEQEKALKQMKRLDPHFDQIPEGNGV